MGKKKQKNKSKLAKKAAKVAKQHGPLTGAVVALGAFASSILASDKLREAAEQLITNAIVRAARTLGTVSEGEGEGEAVKSLASGRQEEEREKEEREEELGVGEPLPTH